MKRGKWYVILGRYFRQHLSTALLFFGFVSIFSVIFRLYDLETEAVWYASGLCFLFAAVVICVPFFYLRLGSESSDYVFREYDLDTIIRQAIHKYAPQFIRRMIRLEYTPVKIRVLTDEKWLLLIIEQVMSNSIKYTQQGSVTITVTPDKVLKIADTGIGIASEDLPRIFEKGFTGYNGRLDKKSTGLGLVLMQDSGRQALT